jgi:hypothetical protein
MKTLVLNGKRPVQLMPLLVSVGIAMSISNVSLSASANGYNPVYGDTIVIKKQTVNKKIKIKLYPSANQQVLFFSATGEAGKVYQLFVFDLDGKLVKQVNIRNKQTTVLNNIGKGDYLYEVFSDDDRIENGQLLVK